MDLLNDSPVCVLKGDEFLPKEGMTFAQQVTTYFVAQGGFANSPFGVVVLDKKGVQNSKQHGISRIKSASFAAVKDVLEKGIIILPLDNYGTNNKKEMTGMIAAPIQIGEEKYVCVVEVIANLEQQRLYLHESFLTKNLQEVVASNSVHGNNVNASSPQPQGEIAKVLHNYLISKQNEQNNDNNIKEHYMKSKTNKIRLTESDLHRIVENSVKKILESKTKKDPMQKWFNDFNKASKFRENMDYIEKGGRNPNKGSDNKDKIEESYHKENGIQRIAYENQGMRSKIKEVAQFADLVASVARSEGRDNYYKFYKPLASNIFQMLNLWGFLGDIDD